MGKYDVILSAAAQNDFLGVLEYYNSFSPEDAKQHYDQFMEKAEILRTAPDSCPHARDTQLRLCGYRTLNVMKNVFFFIIKGNSVLIRRILFADHQYYG